MRAYSLFRGWTCVLYWRLASHIGIVNAAKEQSFGQNVNLGAAIARKNHSMTSPNREEHGPTFQKSAREVNKVATG